jgi:thiamine biosynthesis lipoprotein
MKEVRDIMGMPIEIEIVGQKVEDVLNDAFAYLTSVDERFSTYKKESEISRINRGEVGEGEMSDEMKEVFVLAEKTKKETNGYFDIRRPDGTIDPSGIVKGWAIYHTATRIKKAGYTNFFVNAGGDIALSGKNERGNEWSVGIKNPFNLKEVVKVIYPHGKGVATSGSYLRGAHIYNPLAPKEELSEIKSITIIGPDVLEADRFATAAFAMGKKGISFIESVPGLEGYMIDAGGTATLTSGFSLYTTP